MLLGGLNGGVVYHLITFSVSTREGMGVCLLLSVTRHSSCWYIQQRVETPDTQCVVAFKCHIGMSGHSDMTF